MDLPQDNNIFTLQEALETAGHAVQYAFPDRFWVVAEIASVSPARPHVYIDLVQKDPGGALIAKSRACIWQRTVQTIFRGFTESTGQPIAAGMNALMCCSIGLHPVYGLSFTVHAIDGAYTLGEMARQKREVIDRLTREALIDMNKTIDFPLVPQRIAIVSSATAAGYEDFVLQLAGNSNGYRFSHTLFEAKMQGDEAERSLIAALKDARPYAHRFDVLVLIRGGGSKIDLHCFDTYGLAKAIATFPIPVITGIGHERDDSVADLVAFQRCKTPTAVAEMLIQCTDDFEQTMAELQMRVMRAAAQRLETARHTIERCVRSLQAGVLHTVHRRAQELSEQQEQVRTAALIRIERERSAVDRVTDKVALLDPINVLRRGYSLVYTANGALVRSVGDVRIGEPLRIGLADGGLTSQVTGIETAKSGKEEDELSDAV